MLHEKGPLHDLHDGSAMLHSQGSVLRAPLRHVSVVPLRHALRSPTGAMLHDPMRSALRLPSGSRAGLLPTADMCRTAGSQLRRSQPGQLRRPE